MWFTNKFRFQIALRNETIENKKNSSAPEINLIIYVG